MRVYEIMARVGERLVERAPMMTNYFSKIAMLGGAGLFGYGIEDKPLLSVAGGVVSAMGLLMDKVRESVVIEGERREERKNLEAAMTMEDDGLPL